MPIETDEIISATPKTLVAGMSAFITSWFGLEHYAPHVQAFEDHYRGPKGEKLIGSETSMIGEMKNIVHAWKSDMGTVNKQCKHPVSNSINRLKAMTDNLGLTKETELLDSFLQREGAWLSDQSAEGARREVYESMLASKSLFFDLFSEALDPSYARSSKSQEKIMMRGQDIHRFFKEHNHKTISHIRNPITVVVTGAVMAATAITQIHTIRDNKDTKHLLAELQGRVDDIADQVER